MKDIKEILEIEEKYKKLLMDKLKDDGRLSLSCPDFKYPEPVFVYVKAVKTEKSIAVRLDGGDGTMRFWDYVDDDYSDEDGVWEKMNPEGLNKFVAKIYKVMDKAIDIELYDINGECDDYFSGVANFEFTSDNARKAVKKFSSGIQFTFAKFSNFFGDIQYVFDKNFNLVKR